jgi:hypothetical protein
MSCRYCQVFQTSKHRQPDGRFCSIIQRMVPDDGTMCDRIELITIFWCNKNESQMDFRMCSARQSRGESECSRCRQKRDIMDTRRYAGRLSKVKEVPVPKKSILIRR